MSEVYYRILLDRDNNIFIACLQDLNEVDSYQSRFLSDKKFESEDGAFDFIRKSLIPKDKIEFLAILTWQWKDARELLGKAYGGNLYALCRSLAMNAFVNGINNEALRWYLSFIERGEFVPF